LIIYTWNAAGFVRGCSYRIVDTCSFCCCLSHVPLLHTHPRSGPTCPLLLLPCLVVRYVGVRVRSAEVVCLFRVMTSDVVLPPSLTQAPEDLSQRPWWDPDTGSSVGNAALYALRGAGKGLLVPLCVCVGYQRSIWLVVSNLFASS
jgi:hypothetical protein